MSEAISAGPPSESHEHHTDAAAHRQPVLFTDAEVANFRAEDVSAGAAIVILMTLIFGVGLILYIIVAWAVPI